MPFTAATFPTSLKTIDLHYHAGTERPQDVTLLEYVRHAWDTGRRWQGITDHVDLYFNDHPSSSRQSIYADGTEGISQLHQDFCTAAGCFPDMRLFFAPEYHTEFYADGRVRYPFTEIDPAVVQLADYIICDVGLNTFAPLGLPALTDATIRTLGEIAALSERTGKPVYYAHPLRYVVERTISPHAHPGRDELDRIQCAEKTCAACQPLPLEDLNQLFQVDLPALGRAACDCCVPLEINGMTQNRFRRNHPLLYPAYVQAYSVMAEAGARFVPGSDQHHLHEADCLFASSNGDHGVILRDQPFATLGSDAVDWDFLARIGIPKNSMFPNVP